MTAALALSLVLPGRAAAADHVLDISTPMVLTSTEFTGMGGAGVAFSTGAGGLVHSPASMAVRPIEDQGFFYPSGTISWITVGPRGRVDLGNTGELVPGWEGGMVNLGGGALVGRFGIGLTGTALRYSDDGRTFTALENHLAAAGAVPGLHLVAGLSLRTLVVELRDGDASGRFGGAGAELGLLWAEGRAG